MYDRKIEQLKQAMKAILHELKDTDLFDIVEFNTFVKVWDLNNKTVNFPTNSENDYWYSGPSHANIEVSITKIDSCFYNTRVADI